MLPLKTLKASDRLGLLYGNPFPYILTAGVVIPPGSKFMSVILPIVCDGFLPHQVRVPIELQRTYGAQIASVVPYRAFFTDPKLAENALISKMGASFELIEDMLHPKVIRSIDELKDKFERFGVVTKTDAECTTMIQTANAQKTQMGVI